METTFREIIWAVFRSDGCDAGINVYSELWRGDGAAEIPAALSVLISSVSPTVCSEAAFG